MDMRVGSLFSGYGGLDMAVGGDLAWYSEIEPAACKVLAAHHPGVPNLGDVTKVDWATVPPIDVLTGGYPCQPFSHAGKRKGKHDERHLWPYIVDALRSGVLRRGGVAVFENVDGHRSMGLADVLLNLAELGMSARWGVVRASDAGAPHSRARVFIVATHTDSHGHGEQLHAARVGSLEGKTEGQAPQRKRARSESDSGVSWGKYAKAISRWEPIVGRSAPTPTHRRNDRERLNPVFVEWLMGVPEGHVTGHGLSATQELKMLGNGVCPQQAALALRLLGAA